MSSKAFAALLLFTTLLFLLLGCTQGIPQAPGQNTQASAPNAQAPAANPQQGTSGLPGESGGLPEPDCLGITAEKMQQACGSGKLIRTMSLILDGYKCTYHALDSEGFGGLSEVEGMKVLGVQSELAYMTGKSIAQMKAEVAEVEKPDSLTDIQGGFYTKKWGETGVFVQKGNVLEILRANDMDYESYGLSQSLGCSTDELLRLAGSSSSTAAPSGGKPAPTGGPKEGTKSTAEVEEPWCCTVYIAKQAGAVENENGEQMNPGDTLQAGDRIYASDADITIAVECSDDPGNVKIFVIKAGEPTEISIVEGEDGKPEVVQDPGTAKVSVKELAQFATDPQVSTPRLTCSVRG